VSVIDFANSYMTFFTKPSQGENIARIQIDAAATITDDATGESSTFYLIMPCRSEYMYLDSQLFQMPNYEFGGVFAEDQIMILRTGWTSDCDNHEVAAATGRFAKIDLSIRHLPSTETLKDDQATVEATLANRPIVARTTIRDEASGRTATLNYPIKTMNVTVSPPRFQVDTGPMLVPNFVSTATHAIERLDVAHVVYHQRNQAECVVRRPHQVGERDGQPVSVSDYCEIVTFPAVNELFAGS